MEYNKKQKEMLFLLSIFVVILMLGIYFYRKMNPTMEYYTATFFDVFDTKSDISAYTLDEETFRSQVAFVKNELEDYHKLYDIYHDYEGINNIKTINDYAGVRPVKVDEKIIALFQFAKEMYEETDGEINIAMGSVLEIWHEYRTAGIENPDEAKLPTRQELEEAKFHSSMDAVVIDEKASTIYLSDPEMSIDVGSIGKGFAVQRVVETARSRGIDHMLLNIGGNVCAIGTKPDGSEWRIGVQNPDLENHQEFVSKILLKDSSLVTSGDYQRYYEVDGTRYCHIIDGESLMPSNYFASVSILCKDSGRADALSTAVFNMDVEEGIAFIDNMKGVEAIWVLHDGSLRYSKNIKDFILE